MVVITCTNTKHHCNYRWNTKTRLAKATCPNCSATVKVPQDKKAASPPGEGQRRA